MSINSSPCIMDSLVEHIDGIASEAEYDHAVSLMNRVLDIMGENEQHPLAGLLELLAAMVGGYDREHYAIEAL